jgi:hypothetical protein
VDFVVLLVMVVRGSKGRRREQYEQSGEHELLHGGIRMAQEGIDETEESVEESRKRLDRTVTVVTTAAGGRIPERWRGISSD